MYRFFASVTLLLLLLPTMGSTGNSGIVPELMQDADAIMNRYDLEFVIKNSYNGVAREKMVITILSPQGRSYATFQTHEDKFQRLSKFSATLYRQGKKIKKVSRKALSETEYFEGLASDAKTYLWESPMGIYPYTLEIEIETEYTNGFIEFPSFFPQQGCNMSVVSASYRIKAPHGMELRYKSNRIDSPQRQEEKNYTLWNWTVDSIPAFKTEALAPPYLQMIPWLCVTPVDITYDHTQGRLDNWNELGKWLYSLQEGHDLLSEEAKQKVRQLTDTCTTDLSKIDAIYRFIQQNTRYISIQIGIGGLQPMPAQQVYDTGFGDCKALSNYTMALLKEAGINAYNTIVHTDRARLLSDFATASQANHEVLMVPLPNDTLWLECTNPQYPLRFIPSHLQGHDAIAITPQGGVFLTIPRYPDEKNLSIITAHIQIAPDGDLSGKVHLENRLSQYENLMYFQKLTRKEQIDFICQRITLPNPHIETVRFAEEKSASPCATLDYTFSTQQGQSISGRRIFVPLNLFRPNLLKLPRQERIHPIHISEGIHNVDTIRFAIPRGYTIESLPHGVTLETPFGSFKASYVTDGDTLCATYDLLVHSGLFDKEQYSILSDFFKQVNEAYQSTAVLKPL